MDYVEEAHQLVVAASDEERVTAALSYLDAVALGSEFPAGSRRDVLTSVTVMLAPDLPVDHPLWVETLIGRCSAYFLLHMDKPNGTAEHLRSAVDAGRAAMSLTWGDAHQRTRVLVNLGRALVERSLRRSQRDVDEGIGLLTEALGLTEDLAPVYSNLSAAYQIKSGFTDSRADLAEMITMAEQAVRHTPEWHPQHVLYLANLASAHITLFNHTGDVTDLDKAITLAATAVRVLTPNHPEYTRHLATLSNGYHLRTKLTGDSSDLDRAITYGTRAIATHPPGHGHTGAARADLSTLHQLRWARTRNVDDLHKALRLADEAIDQVDPADLAEALTVAGHARRDRYLSTGDLTFLHATIDTHLDAARRARTLTTSAMCRYNAATSLLLLYQRMHDPEVLDRAHELVEPAVDGSPDDHPDTLRRVAKLAETHRLRHDLGHPVTRGTLRDLVGRVRANATASPVDQVRTRQEVGLLASAMGDVTTAVSLFDEAIDLLPAVAPRESDWQDQEQRYGGHHDLVTEAVAAHCAAGDPAGALRVAEQGRGMLLNGVLDDRGDLPELLDLERTDPSLAFRFRDHRARLSASGGPNQFRRQRWSDYDRTLATIRARQGFHDFLLFRLDSIRLDAHEAVVLVSSGRYRTNAIVLTAGTQPRVLTLPGVDREVVAAYSSLLETLSQDSAGTDVDAAAAYGEILSWLWKNVGSPVLTALPAVDRPRVWWLPVGLMGSMPLHAAQRRGEPGMLDLVVSSYTPTLRMWAEARAKQARPRVQLVVNVAGTGDRGKLNATAREAAELHRVRPDLPLLRDADATPDHVLAALRSATWVHFCCHATVDLDIPSRSGLALAGGEWLRLTSVAGLRMDGGLAYLSACSTSATGLRHNDGAINTASIFQLAGFTDVVASLWPLMDNPAAKAARAFYHRVQAVSPAEAVRQAAVELRERYPDRPDAWASLIHSGPSTVA